MQRMIAVLTVLVVLAMLATLGVLFAGMLGLVRHGGGEEGSRRSNALMRWRIVLQAIALLLFALLLSLLHT